VTVAVEELDAKSARAAIPDLAAVLADCVAGGASVSFMEGFGRAEAAAFFKTVFDSVAKGDTVLLAAGTKGKRFALPNSRVMIHQPTGGAGGQAADIAIAAREILRWRQTLNEALSRHTGKSPAQIDKDSDRDYYMSAEEAKAYGIVDHVVASTREAQTLAVQSAA